MITRMARRFFSQDPELTKKQILKQIRKQQNDPKHAPSKLNIKKPTAKKESEGFSGVKERQKTGRDFTDGSFLKRVKETHLSDP